MARKPLSREEYFRRGKTVDLTLIGNASSRATIPTLWKCDICGRELFKSLNGCLYHSPCVCRTQMTLKATDYETLANRLGITWSGQYPPHNKVKIEWFGTHGESFYASYNEIGYSFISNRLRRYIYG